MSAIFGIIQWDGGEVDRADLKRMGAALAHRGPHGVATDGAGSVQFGHCLLRVNVEDRFEAQPLASGDSSFLLVADARIDNRAALVRDLGIDTPTQTTMPDSAIILTAWQRWGEEAATRLIGDFAFAVWDDARRHLTLVRDGMGMRSLYYHRGDRFIAFASEAKALHAVPRVPRALNDLGMVRWLLREPRYDDGVGFFAGLEWVKGGTTLCISAGRPPEERRFWSPRADPRYAGLDRPALLKAYREVLGEAVACRVRRLIDRPAVLLSGGFDSTAIAGLCRTALPEGGSVIGITSALPEGARSHPRDARPGAAAAARHMPHMDHDWLDLGQSGVLGAFDRRAQTGDRPPYPLGYVEDAMLAWVRAKGARLVMDGIGGDATLNPRLQRFVPDLFKAGKMRRFWREARAEARVKGVSLYAMLRRRVFPFVYPEQLRRIVLAWRTGGRLFSHPYVQAAAVAPLIECGDVAAYDPRSILDRRPDIERRIETLEMLSFRAQQNGAIEAAGQGLELTRPMLDIRVVELGLAIPSDMQIIDGRNRAMALDALGTVLPPEFRTRARGQEFLDPAFESRARDDLPQMRAHLDRLRDHPAVARYIDVDRLARDLSSETVENLHGIDFSYAVHAYMIARYIAWFRRDNF